VISAVPVGFCIVVAVGFSVGMPAAGFSAASFAFTLPVLTGVVAGGDDTFAGRAGFAALCAETDAPQQTTMADNEADRAKRRAKAAYESGLRVGSISCSGIFVSPSVWVRGQELSTRLPACLEI
jgi:hypothetical protein